MRKDGQNAPRLQSVITEAVERVSNIQPRNTIGAREHPTIRSARSSSDVKRDIRARYAFVNGGQNTITTAPNFYTPFTTPSSFQIPTNRIEEYLWAQWFFDNEPAVAASIEFYTDFPLSGFQLECGNSKVLEFYQQMVKDLDFARLLPLISQEYHLRGDVFVYASLDCEHCGGTGVDQDTHEPCEHLGAKWKSITLLNPTQVELSPSMMDMQPIYYYMPDEGMKKVVQERKPIATYKSIPDAIKAYIMKNEPIPLDPVCIHHFKRGAAPWQPFGRSMVRRLFPTLVYKDKLRQAQYLVAERHILPFKIAKLGNDDRPASEQDLEMIAEEIANVANDPLMTMIAPHTFELDYVGASGKVLQLTNEFELINQDIFDGFMLNKALLNGEGPSYANAQVGLLSMGQRLNKLRGEIAHWIEENLFKPVAEWNGFEVDNKRGGTKLVYPTVKWDDLQLRDNTNLLQIAMQARQAGDLSSQTMLGLMDINYDQEIERLRMENSYSVSTSPMLPAGEMGNGYRGPMGGGMPPMGGGMPPMGGGMPPMDGGMGMPPAAPGGMPPMPMASSNTPEENYREAVSFTNAVHDSVRTSFYNYTRQVYANKYKSEAHRHFIESQCPIDGTGFRGALAPELSPLIDPLDDHGQYHGGDESVPMNPLAMQERQSDVSNGWIREARKPSKDEEFRPSPYQKFTSWENKLYGIVLSINPPLPFYAQYAAGPDDQYRLDGAFPDIQLGVEADSETYHSTPEYIERDRYRDSQLAAQGWTLLRFTESELKERPDEVQALIMRTIQHLIKRKLGN